MAGTRFRLLGRYLSVVAVAAPLLVPSGVPAEENAGEVIDHSGTVTSGPSSEDRRAVKAGSPIVVGDRLISDSVGRAEIEFRNGIRLVIGPRTDLRIRSFMQDPDVAFAGAFDLFEGAVRAEVPDDVGDTLAFPTNTAVIVGKRAAWTVIAEEENTVVVVHRGKAHVQQLDVGRGGRGPLVELTASFGVEVPAGGPIGAPWEMDVSEIEALDRRLLPGTKAE